MSTEQLKPKVLQLLALAYQQELVFAETLSQQERDAVGTRERWSAKDVLASIAAWKLLQAGKLFDAIHGDTPPVWKDMSLVNKMNENIFTQHQHLLWSQVMQEARHAYEVLVARVESMNEAELTEPQRYTWQENEPLYEETLGNGVWYPYTCMTQFYLRQGNVQRAFYVYETLTEAMREMKMPAHLLANMLYNLACLYAMNGRPQKALTALEEAFRLKPSLIRWSKQDNDLQSLHNNPTFVNLCETLEPGERNLASVFISPQEVQQRGKNLLIVDVRSPQEYATGHVQDAVNISLGQIRERLGELAQDRPIVTYCNMYHRGSSRGEQAAELLSEEGYQVFVLDGGYPAWEAQDLPIVEA